MVRALDFILENVPLGYFWGIKIYPALITSLLAVLCLGIFLLCLSHAAKHQNGIRRMSSQESAAFLDRAHRRGSEEEDPGNEIASIALQGPAVGAEMRVSTSISVMRQLYQEKMYGLILAHFGGPHFFLYFTGLSMLTICIMEGGSGVLPEVGAEEPLDFSFLMTGDWLLDCTFIFTGLFICALWLSPFFCLFGAIFTDWELEEVKEPCPPSPLE